MLVKKIQIVTVFIFVVMLAPLKAQTTFTESAAAYNLNIAGGKDGGLAWADYDLDGDYDLVINTNGRGYLLRNDGGSFIDVTNINGSLAPDFLNASLERTALFVDFNNDGYPDVFRNDSNQARIYLQDPATNKFGDGIGGTTPNQIFNNSNFADGFNSEGAGALDFDGDGDLDIFIDNHNFGIDILLNDGTGNFTQATAKSASPNPPYNVADPTTWPLGLVQDATDGDYGSATDFNNDGWVDVVARKRNQVDLFTNLGGTFGNGVDIDQASNGNKGAVGFYDFDNDGDFDLYWTENGTNQIHRNNGDGTWTGLGAATGIPISFPGQMEGLACGDVDNDGDIDIFLANGGNGGSQTGRLYLNQINNGGAAMTFVDSGLSFPNRGEGCTFIDIDNDGDLDLYMNRNNTNNLFINNLPAAARANHLYINVKEDRDAFGLTGIEKRFAIGSTATILDCNGTVISGIREVNGGYGHGTQEPGVIHFGLPSGSNTPIVLEVSYPRTTTGRVVVRQQITPSDFNNGSINIVEILPNIINQPPIAQDDLITVTQGGTVTFNPLADNGNGVDSDPEGTALTVISITQPPLTEGTAVLNGDGTVTYSPGAYSGATFFTYTVRDNDPACPLLAEETTGTVLITVNTDNDGDGINNDVDLDDDNDGIPDIEENANCNGVTVNNVFVDENYGTGNRNTLPFTNYCYEDGTGTNPCSGFPGNVNVNDGEYALLQFAAPYDINIGGSDFGSWLTIGDHTGNTNGRMAVYNAALAAGEFYNRPVASLIANVDVNINFWALNLLRNGTGGILPNITIEIRDLSNNLVFTSGTGDIPENDIWNNYSFTFNPGNNTDLRFILINNAPGGGGNDLALDDIRIAQILCDTDGDGIANQFDLDADNDGIYDVVESGALNAGASDANNDGIIDGASFGANGLFNGIENNDTLSATLTYTLSDSDNDGNYDIVELDSDNDNCNDVDEAGYTDTNNDGLLGPLPVITNGNGVVTSGSNGYTTPADINTNTIFDFQEAGAIPTINTQPTDQIICAGDNGNFSVIASGLNLTYQWQISTDGGTSFSDLSNGAVYVGTATNTLNIISATEPLDQNQYRVIISNSAYACGEIISNTAILRVPNVSCIPLGIDPSTCGGANGFIILSGLASSTEYQVNYIDDGVPVGPLNYTSNASGQVVISGLDAGLYTGLVVSLLGCTDVPENITLSDPSTPISPVSGGNITECVQNPIQTLTATATAPSGSTVVWYDAAIGGSIVATPSLNTIGTVSYFAESQNAITLCNSTTRTEVVLTLEQCLADLSLIKIVDNASPNQGDNITFTLTISNAGPFAPTNIIVEDILPNGVTFLNANTIAGVATFDVGTRTLTWDLGATVLSNSGNNSRTLTYTVTVEVCGEFINQAEIVNSSFDDPDSTPNNGR